MRAAINKQSVSSFITGQSSSIDSLIAGIQRESAKLADRQAADYFMVQRESVKLKNQIAEISAARAKSKINYTKTTKRI